MQECEYTCIGTDPGRSRLGANRGEISDTRMHNQHHHDDMVTVNLAAPEVAEAMPQLLLQSEFGEQALEDDQPRERGQLLRLETHI